jgi:hypothetical protein
MKHIRFLLLLLALFVALDAVSSQKSPAKEDSPPLPVLDYHACPFEGCTFGKWIVIHDSTAFTTWREGRKPWLELKKGEVVTGLTGVHITYKPDRVQILESIPELRLQSGDVILRFMYHGEGFSDLWIKGRWLREYDSSFITEKAGSGCMRGCSAKVVVEGRKDWWVRLRTAEGKIGWSKVDDQFDCMDSFGGEPECDNL